MLPETPVGLELLDLSGLGVSAPSWQRRRLALLDALAILSQLPGSPGVSAVAFYQGKDACPNPSAS